MRSGCGWKERRAALSSELQRVQAQLGDAPPAAPSSQPEEEETLGVVCMDAPKKSQHGAVHARVRV